MQITKHTVPTLSITISDATGKIIEGNRAPLAYLHGGYGGTLPRIEEALEGKQAGDRLVLDLQAGDAFGERDPLLERTIPKAEFPPGVKVGGQLEGRSDAGHVLLFTVLKVKGDKVLLDGNHPLAGRDLRFTIEVQDVRAASDEEIAHQHVHGAHGHQH